MKRPKITILGGGPYVTRLIEQLADASPERDLEIALCARRQDRLEVIAKHVRERLRRRTSSIAVHATPRRAEALAGANVVVLLIRIGGLAARAHDETFPRSSGLVGDEGLGPGGLANAWRTFPELQAIARDVRAQCQNAIVINMMAPLGLTTRLLHEEHTNAFGLCELPQVTRARILERNPAEDTHGEGLWYAGFNHLGFFWPRTAAGLTSLERAAQRGDVEPELFTRFGAAPLHYVADVFFPAIARKYGRTKDANRARALEHLTNELVERYRHGPGETYDVAGRPTPWFDLALVPVLQSLLGGQDCDVFLNVRNDNGLTCAPPATFVECEARVTRNGIHVAPAETAPPSAVAAFLARIGEFEQLAFQACLQHDESLVRSALHALPLEISKTDVTSLTRSITGPVTNVCAEEGPT